MRRADSISHQGRRRNSMGWYAASDVLQRAIVCCSCSHPFRSAACWRVGGLEYEDICGPCNPGVHYEGAEKAEKKKAPHQEQVPTNAATGELVCPACTQEQCDSDLNRCPVYKRAFVCTEGTSKGGCSGDPQFWAEEEQCGMLDLVLVPF